MKKVISAVAVVAMLAMGSVSAFWSGDDSNTNTRWNGNNTMNNTGDYNGNGYGNGWGDGSGDMDADGSFEITIKANGRGRGKGAGKSGADSKWNGNGKNDFNNRFDQNGNFVSNQGNGYYPQYRPAPYGYAPQQPVQQVPAKAVNVQPVK